MAGAEEVTSYSPASYEADEFTLHLWHLDEESAPFGDEGTSPTTLLGLHNGAESLESSLPGMGRAVSFNHFVRGTPGQGDLVAAVVTASKVISMGPADRAPDGFQYFGEGGAFTYEAVVKLDVLPGDAEVIAMSIVSMDGEGKGKDSERIFNLRIEREGFLNFTPLKGGGAPGGAMASLPKIGPHAVNTTDWFHVAVTYSGQEDDSNNLRLYWTRIGAGASSANFIGGGTLIRDFNGQLGDFALGNEVREFFNRESEPFLGSIDEVRISSVARHPTDYLFVPPSQRSSPLDRGRVEAAAEPSVPLDLQISEVLVDGEPVQISLSGRESLVVSSGFHRLDFDLGFSPGSVTRQVHLRSQLVGLDETWRKAGRGMSLIFEVLDAQGEVISQSIWESIGSSPGWTNRLEESDFVPRTEPLFIPRGAAALRVSLDSGSADTTGSFAIDSLEVVLPGGDGASLWPNGDFSQGDTLSSAAGVPDGWRRGGSDPVVAQMLTTMASAVSEKYSLALIDGDQQKAGNWTAEIPLDGALHGGKTVATRWLEAYNVAPGNVHRASYRNVPPGLYTFRAIWLEDGPVVGGGSIELPIRIPPALWQNTWFWVLLTALVVTLVTTILIQAIRRRTRRQLRQLWMQNVLERDRSRIARDMHDDLGTRVSVIDVEASLASGKLEDDPEGVRRHLNNLGTSARTLVTAMDELVWAVDPGHDSLDHLASYLTRLGEDLFGEGPVRCRLSIPSDLPDHELGSEFRHHVALSVKEALNNVLKHAGPCEVLLSLSCDDEQLRVEVRDTGRGFDLEALPKSRHGLKNLKARMDELGGTCEIASSPGKGTCVSLLCPMRREDVQLIP